MVTVLLELPTEVLVRLGRSVKNICRRDLVSFCLANRMLKTVLTPVLWEEVILGRRDARKLEPCLQVLATSDEVAAAVRVLRILDLDVEVRGGYAPVSLCELFAAGLRKMPGLLELEIDRAGFHGPAVIAALCAREESSLRKIKITIGKVQDGKELPELKDLKLLKGNLTEVALLTSQYGGYPQQYADALARIYNSSRNTIEDLRIARWHEEAMLFSSTSKVFPKLRKFSLWDNNLKTNAILVNTLHSNLRDLELHCVELPSTDLMNSIPMCFPSLRYLYLYFARATPDDDLLRQFGRLVIAYMPELEVIKLYYHDDHDGGTEREYMALRQWSKYNKSLQTAIFDHDRHALQYWQRRRDNAWAMKKISRDDPRFVMHT